MPYLRQVVYWKSLKLTEYSFMPYLRHFRTISTLVYVYSNRAIKASSVILSHFQAFQPCKSYMKIYIILEDSLLVTRLSGYCTGVRENYLETQTQKMQPIWPHFVCLSGGQTQMTWAQLAMSFVSGWYRTRKACRNGTSSMFWGRELPEQVERTHKSTFYVFGSRCLGLGVLERFGYQ